ncbi:YceI family protein [Maribacter aestuarii]|uniref:YceI family protein n=1 Tax=Maribacter aestuarii TaxID=1130723 RepID=UPI00248CE61D|nr:YceI family protein [Maribacter aestuarii]
MRVIIALILILSLKTAIRAQTPSEISSAEITFNFLEKDVDGSIGGFTSKSSIDWNAIENSTISGSVETETIKTGNFIRDWSLRGSKYFDADQYPKITFTSNKIANEGADVLVDGLLTIKGISKPVQIQFKREGKQLLGTTTLFCSDFDITILKKGREANKVLVQFNLQWK